MLAFVSGPAPTSVHQTPVGGAGAASGAPSAPPSTTNPEASTEAGVAIGAASVAAGLAMASRRNRRRDADAATRRRFDEKDIESADIMAVIRDTKTYREADRTTRRPVFGYPDWKRHRSADRFIRNLQGILVSRVARGIWLEVLIPTTVSLLLVLATEVNWEPLLGPEVVTTLPTFTISALPWTVSSAALSLLLVFKTNSAYDRWWEARIVWGAIVNKCRDITRQAIARIDNDHVPQKENIVCLTAAFPRVLHYHLSEQTPEETEQLSSRLSKLMPPAQAEKIMNATHKPMTLCGEMSKTLERSNLQLYDKLKIDRVVSDFADYYGMCERIFKTPMPLAYTRLTARFLTIWLLFLPFAIYSQVNPHWIVVPITALISFFVFGIEELGIIIEEPFSVLPLEKIGDGIQASMFEALELDKRKRKKAESAANVKKMPEMVSRVQDNKFI